MKNYICSRCNIEKPQSEFWFDKRRDTIRNPCKLCSKKKGNIRDHLRYANNTITRSDILNHYNGKKLPKNIIDFFTDTILLNRQIKRMEKPLLKQDDNNAYIFCPFCGDYELVHLPNELERLIVIMQLFINDHGHTKK